MQDCIFCKIISGEIPAAKIYEDEKIIGFLDIMPINKGHTLVVPKNHSENMLKDSEEDLSAAISAAKKIAIAVMKITKADGFNLGCNTNKAAGQAVFHTHFHIIPRFDDDGFKHWPQSQYEEGEMEEFKLKISKELS